MKVKLGDTVTIWESVARKYVTGTVTRIWTRPVNDPHITVTVDGYRTYVRSESRVYLINADLANATPGTKH